MQQPCIAIIKECKNKWERRCSLTPVEVKKLVNDFGIKVIVQPSSNRCFSNKEFQKAGAIVQEDVNEASVIFGVKEVPIANLIPDKTYFFFSHTIKAQLYNMDLLDKMLEHNIRMIDFECIREAAVADPKRLVAFGRYAGIAGAFDFIRGCGEFLLQKGWQTPFIYLGSAYMYQDFEAMKDALRKIGQKIDNGGLPDEVKPLVFAVTGTGRVSQGILEVLEVFPHVKVEPDNLKDYVENYSGDNDKIVISVFSSKDLVRHKEGKAFDKSHYYSNPKEYENKFEEQLPYVNFLIAGQYWENKFPRVITEEGLKQAQLKGKSNLMGVCDISADYEGCVEFTKRFTTIEEPFLVYDGQEKTFYEKIADAKDNCVLFHCVDHLPAEMPVEASHHFGEKLFPFVKSVVESPITKPFEEQTKDLPAEIANAVICTNGSLTPNFRYIPDLRKINEKEAQQKRYEEEAPKKGIPRNLSIVTLSLKGHLFDTKCFNSCIDICEEHSVQFRVIGWDIGNQSTQSSSVSLQMVAREKVKLADALDKIEEVAEKCNVELANVEESTMM